MSLIVQYPRENDDGGMANAEGDAMCLIALFYRVLENAPVILGANREEAYARGGEPPRILPGPCRAVAETCE